jgi:predicted enzyme related to lactoylglutathione lyase
MRPLPSTRLALSLVLAVACGGSSRSPTAAAPTARAPAANAGLQIKLTSVLVDDQEKALRFYTDVLGFVPKDDERNGDYRWLTVTSPADPDGTAVLLSLDSDPAARAYRQSRFEQGQPAIMFFTDDIAADHARIKATGAEITPLTDVPGYAIIATLLDTCGNLVQITQLAP